MLTKYEYDRSSCFRDIAFWPKDLFYRYEILFLFPMTFDCLRLIKGHLLTYEKYYFSLFIFINSINMCKIRRQFIPYTINFMRITSVQSIITNAP